MRVALRFAPRLIRREHLVAERSAVPGRIALFALALGGALALAGCVSTSELATVPTRVTGTAGAQGATTPDGGELWLIPSPAAGILMRASVYRPAGAGPFPLAIINHGSEQDPNERALAPLPAFPALTQWFLARGYAVVVPERLGHGLTGGPYLEDQGPCDGPDYVAAGNGAADSIAAAMKYMAGQAGFRPTGIIVAGNSAGAWGALALAARHPAGVSAVVDFAGGRGGHDDGMPLKNCSPDRLVAAAGIFGKGERIPTLWLYAANDTYFPPELSQRMADAFRAAGGNVEYHLLPAVGEEGHGLITTSGPSAPWVPYVDAFVRAHS